ncbi:hypothetical protein [Mycolicibacterium komossense]
MRHMNRHAALGAALAIAAAGCSCPPAAADGGLPSCVQTTVMINPATPQGHPNCRMHSHDRLGLTFDVSYWSPDDAEPLMAVKISVTDPTGALVQTIDELLEPTSPAGVGLEDIDGDGRDEIIIPMGQTRFNGSPNTRFSVWRAAGDSSHFERTQMVGQALYPSGDGYVVTNGGALTSRDLTFYLPTGAGFTLITSLTIEPEQVDPDTGRVLTVSCRAHQEEGLGSIDMEVHQAEEVFCASPAALAIWPGAQRVSI